MSQVDVLAAMMPEIETFDCLEIDYYVGEAVASKKLSFSIRYKAGWVPSSREA